MKYYLQSIYVPMRLYVSLIRHKDKLIFPLSLSELNQFNKKFHHQY
jgi:hypothetical protein